METCEVCLNRGSLVKRGRFQVIACKCTNFTAPFELVGHIFHLDAELTCMFLHKEQLLFNHFPPLAPVRGLVELVKSCKGSIHLKMIPCRCLPNVYENQCLAFCFVFVPLIIVTTVLMQIMHDANHTGARCVDATSAAVACT